MVLSSVQAVAMVTVVTDGVTGAWLRSGFYIFSLFVNSCFLNKSWMMRFTDHRRRRKVCSGDSRTTRIYLPRPPGGAVTLLNRGTLAIMLTFALISGQHAKESLVFPPPVRSSNGRQWLADPTKIGAARVKGRSSLGQRSKQLGSKVTTHSWSLSADKHDRKLEDGGFSL